MAAESLLMETTVRSPIRMRRGAGSWLVDSTGRRYLDFVQARGTNSLGHASPVVAHALAQQALEVVHMEPSFIPEPAAQLARLLRERSGLHQVFFCNSGTEANETAIKLVRKWGLLQGKGHEIVTFAGAFHGRTFGSMSATGRQEYAAHFGPLLPGFRQARLNDIDSVREQVGPRTAAILLEVIQGESGVICARPEFLHALRELCHRERILLVFDEVQTGCGRLGHFFGFEHFGVVPDVVCLGKGMAGGVPLAAVLAARDACVFTPGDHGGTFNGSALATAVGLAVLQVIGDASFLAHVREVGTYLSHRLDELSADLRLHGAQGAGLLQRLDLGRPVGAKVVARARSVPVADLEGGHALLLNSPRPNLLRFLPALNVTRAEVDAMVLALHRAVDTVLREAPD
jgi:acetylornithine/N-succinyldiaminopimelate aminotransferase